MEFEPNYMFEIGDIVKAIAIDGEKPETCFNTGTLKPGYDYVGKVISTHKNEIDLKRSNYTVKFSPAAPYKGSSCSLLEFSRNELLLIKKKQEDLPIPGMDEYINVLKVKKPKPEEAWI